MPELIAGGFFIGIAIEFYSQLIIFCLQTQNLVPISLFFGVFCVESNFKKILDENEGLRERMNT
ncbi:hypothetical protein IHE45_15G045700 [Dioscorea alata]|uniref:Uncharacterized protein n=1 Tax=Dioscorea alata TaxID=55571 RepID=A0ACB7UL70_DIOAL|nr:hypothetical protein IHE45_15G045700 [Dioscorea alata]